MKLKDKKGVRMFSLTLVFICIFTIAIGQIAFKTGMKQVGEITNLRQLFSFATLFDIFTNFRILIGLFLYVITAILWLGALSKLNVSFMHPLLGLSYAITAIFAFLFLRENLTLFQWIGILLVVGGAFLITKQYL